MSSAIKAAYYPNLSHERFFLSNNNYHLFKINMFINVNFVYYSNEAVSFDECHRTFKLSIYNFLTLTKQTFVSVSIQARKVNFHYVYKLHAIIILIFICY